MKFETSKNFLPLSVEKKDKRLSNVALIDREHTDYYGEVIKKVHFSRCKWREDSSTSSTTLGKR